MAHIFQHSRSDGSPNELDVRYQPELLSYSLSCLSGQQAVYINHLTRAELQHLAAALACVLSEVPPGA